MTSRWRMGQEAVLLVKEEDVLEVEVSLEQLESRKTLVLNSPEKQHLLYFQSGGAPLHKQIRATIQRGECRFAGIFLYKHKLCNLESSRNFGWRQMLDMMMWRSGKASYYHLYLADELRTWKFWGV